MDDGMPHGELEILTDVRAEAHDNHVAYSLTFPQLILFSYGYLPVPVQNVPDKQKNLGHCWMREHFGCLYNSIVNFKYLLYFFMVSSTSYLP